MALGFFMNKDLMLYLHVLLGVAVVALSAVMLFQLGKGKASKGVAFLAALVSWAQLLPSAITYLIFYPATKTVIKAGAWPWAHAVVMETKEHWGILIPIIATTAAGLVWIGKGKESRKWWWLLAVAAVLMGVMGRIVKMGALQR
ncbi:hypothetical protein HYU12_00720 [Candidatus Woesearchaeota archaeon]|nr:hypothetical protein [Candidatus Woesearchaeota archaeon]